MVCTGCDYHEGEFCHRFLIMKKQEPACLYKNCAPWAKHQYERIAEIERLKSFREVLLGR